VSFSMKTRYLLPSRISALSKLNRLLLSDNYADAKKFIFVDANTYSSCLTELICRVPALESAEFFEVPVGEETKSLEVASQLWSALLDSHADNRSVILCLGGGCVSDIGGFVAAGFKRGIRYINIPTSLVGMVDASIGGKTAVNISNAKNQVGFFHQPDAVCVHPAFLDSLSDSEIISGLFEMEKYMLLSDADRLHNFFSRYSSALNERHVETDDILHCIDFKRSVVSADPYDSSIRKILNLGHTFGHAIESFAMQHNIACSHGQAVGIGLACELYLSTKKLGLNPKVYDDALTFKNLLVSFPKLSLRDTEVILSYMRNDKKNRDGLILCVLLQEIASPVIDVSLDENEIRDALLTVCK